MKSTSNPKTKVSVIVPVRNEEANIIECLESIMAQEYSKDFYEIIVSDDDSTDYTVKKVTELISEKSSCKIKLIQSNKHISKKQAITNAVEISDADLIITTDADCVMGKNWLSSIIDYCDSKNIKMLVAPVVMNHDHSLYGKLQSLEFASLIASSAAAINLEYPIMCNGANLAFSKKAFIEVKGYDNNKNFISGDDIFLLLKFKKKYGNKSIGFLKDREAIVYTKMSDGLREFYNQRIRWVSKSKGYNDFGIISVALIIFLFNISILTAFIIGDEMLLIAIAMFGIKLVVDFPILAGFTKFINKSGLLWYYLILQPIYVAYISVFGVIGNLFKFNWKGSRY